MPGWESVSLRLRYKTPTTSTRRRMLPGSKISPQKNYTKSNYLGNINPMIDGPDWLKVVLHPLFQLFWYIVNFGKLLQVTPFWIVFRSSGVASLHDVGNVTKYSCMHQSSDHHNNHSKYFFILKMFLILLLLTCRLQSGKSCFCKHGWRLIIIFNHGMNKADLGVGGDVPEANGGEAGAGEVERRDVGLAVRHAPG